MRKILSSIFILVFILISKANAEVMIRQGELLTLERCVEIALRMHPDMLAAKSNIDIYRAKKGQAESGYYPQIDASAGYTRLQPATATSSNLTRSTAGSNSFEQYSTGVTAKQILFDFGKTSEQVKIQSLYTDSARAELLNAEARVAFNVKEAYYGVLKAKRNMDVALETVKQFQQHLERAKAFYEVGTKPKFDVTKAEVDLGNARLNLIKAENALKLAKVRLNNAIGIIDAPEYSIEDRLDFKKYEMNLEDALQKALKNRPELQSLIFKKKAIEQSVSFAKKGYFPYLTGSATYTWAGERFPIGDGWSAGVTLSIPVFSGFYTKNQVSEALANLNTISANEEALKQNIIFDVQQSFLNLKEAEERIAVAELNVKQAIENFEIANGRYAAGVGSPIEVTDADVALSNAKTAYNQALYDYRVSQASIEKAMGMR